MIKFLKDCWTEFHKSQSQLAEMGIWHFNYGTTLFIYVDQEQYQNYLTKKEENNEHS